MKRWISMVLAILLVCGACSFQEETTLPQNSAAAEESSKTEDGAFAVTEHGVAKRYYDYFLTHPYVNLLLCQEGEGFSSAQLSAFVLCTLAEENGGQEGYETGFSPEEMNGAAEKYCGVTIQNFNNNMTYVDQETGMVKATGWGGTPSWWVLHDLQEDETGLRTAIFYYFLFSVDADLPQPQRMEKQLLEGEFSSYGTPYLARMTFREKQDFQTGESYLQILSLEALGDAQAPYTVYGSENS